MQISPRLNEDFYSKCFSISPDSLILHFLLIKPDIPFWRIKVEINLHSFIPTNVKLFFVLFLHWSWSMNTKPPLISNELLKCIWQKQDNPSDIYCYKVLQLLQRCRVSNHSSPLHPNLETRHFQVHRTSSSFTSSGCCCASQSWPNTTASKPKDVDVLWVLPHKKANTCETEAPAYQSYPAQRCPSSSWPM